MADKQILNFINGEFVAAKSGEDVREPLAGRRPRWSAWCHEAGKAEVDAAVQAARAALQGPWGRMDVAERSELLYAVADEINRRFDDFLEAEVADTGKPRIARLAHRHPARRGQLQDLRRHREERADRVVPDDDARRRRRAQLRDPRAARA